MDQEKTRSRAERLSQKASSAHLTRRSFLQLGLASGTSVLLTQRQALADIFTFFQPVRVGNPLATYPNRGWERVYRDLYRYDSSFVFLCAPNDTHNCLLRAQVKNGVAVRIAPTFGYGQALEGEYHRLFATSVAVPLCESSYGWEDKGTILLDVSGFYRAFGLDGNRAQEPVDSIGHELEFLSVLALKEMWAKEEELSEALAVTVEAEQAFLREHLGRWYTVLATRLQQESAHPFYQTVATLLTRWIEDELERFAITPDPLPARLPLQEPEGMPCPLAGGC